MSLDFHLSCTIYTTVFDENITHNLCQMAREAGVYGVLWEPYKHGYTKAGQIVPILREGLERLERDPERYRKFDAENGYGTYPCFVESVKRVLAACREYPNADIEANG